MTLIALLVVSYNGLRIPRHLEYGGPSQIEPWQDYSNHVTITFIEDEGNIPSDHITPPIIVRLVFNNLPYWYQQLIFELVMLQVPYYID